MRQLFYLLLIVISTWAYFSSCKKSHNNVQSSNLINGAWRCSGYESNRFTKIDSTRVWTGVDSQWMYHYSVSDTNLTISNRTINISGSPRGDLFVTNLVYNAYYTICGTNFWDTTVTRWDTLKYSKTDTTLYTDKYILNCPGIHTGKGVIVKLDYNFKDNKIHLIYDWYLPDYAGSDIGSTIYLDGFKQ